MTLHLALVGKDVSASESPRIHRFLLSGWGVGCRYECLSVPSEQFSAVLPALFETDGFNVTIPYKERIVPYVRLLGDAGRFGSVNTVLPRERAGYNTDGLGFLLMLGAAGVDPKGKRALVLGAGGAGKSCIGALLGAGAEVFAYEKDPSRMQAAADRFHDVHPLTAVPSAPYDLIVNCTGIGMHDTVGQTPLCRTDRGEVGAEQLLEGCSLAVDLIYTPAESAFLRAARARGIPALNGASMLFYQAYAADCLFLGRQSDSEEAHKFYRNYLGSTVGE